MSAELSADFFAAILPNKGCRDFLQSRLAAYVKNQVSENTELFVFCGTGGNGKTTMLHFIKELLGSKCEVLDGLEDATDVSSKINSIVEQKRGVPIFLSILDLADLAFLDHWEHTHILPFTARCTSGGTNIHSRIPDFVRDFREGI